MSMTTSDGLIDDAAVIRPTVVGLTGCFDLLAGILTVGMALVAGIFGLTYGFDLIMAIFGFGL